MVSCSKIISFLFLSWSIIIVILLALYSKQELSIFDNTDILIGYLIISHNVLNALASIAMSLLYMTLDDNEGDCYNCIWDCVFIISMSLYFCSYVLGLTAWGEMCHHLTCFYYRTPLYVMLIIYTILITGLLMFIAIWYAVMIVYITPCCQKRCKDCNEKCNYWCYGIRPRWQEPEPVGIENRPNLV